MSTADDIHAYAVSKLLKERFDCSSVILDVSNYPTHGFVQTRIGNTSSASFANVFDFNLDSINTIWWRRPSRIEIDSEIVEPRLRRFTLNEWWTTIEGMLFASKGRFVNERGAESRAAHKILQLQVAQSCGFRVPDTLVTNDPQAVLAFRSIHRDNIIFKPQTDAKYHMAETRPLDELSLAKLELVKLSPVIFQERIPAIYDLRVNIAGESVLCTKIDSQQSSSKLDWRLDLAVPMEPVEVSSEFRQKCRLFMCKMGLEMGALDFRVTPERDEVFLEVNPAGQFLFCEANEKLEVTEAVCRVLSGPAQTDASEFRTSGSILIPRSTQASGQLSTAQALTSV